MFPNATQLIAGVAALVYIIGRGPELVYLAQQESYQVGGYMRHHLRRIVHGVDLAAWLVATIAVACGIFGGAAAVVMASIAMVALGVVALWRWRKIRQTLKKPLVWTARAKRLMVAHGLVGTACCALLSSALPAASLIAGALAVGCMALALAISKPLELSIQLRYKRKANARIRQLKRLNQLRVVGVTGSYGKTSTKFILGAILGAKYDVLVTPNSYNTPMGICKVVNGDLAAHHDVFVAEMGARHRADIRELVDLVEPTCAMITAVGPAHLETFGTVENIARTKFDLARGTAPDGVVVVNGENTWCVEEARTVDRDILFYGVDPAPHLAAYATDVRIEGVHTSFTLVLVGDGEIRCKTRLLGRHNVLNIVGAALLARRMGLTLEELEHGISAIEPVPHRLQLIDPGTGILVIDDAFNSNPEGAKAALDVLAQFHGYRKWIVTPGMAEMGRQSREIHRTFGEQMARVCDHVVLVGRTNAPLMLEGLRAVGFPDERIHVVPSLAAWMEVSSQHWRSGDVILFENDFADHMEQAL